MATAAGIAGVALCAVFALPWAMTRAAAGLVRTDPVSRADAVFALAGDARGLRNLRAVEIYRAGLAGKVVVSGQTWGDGIDTAAAARELVIAAGVRRKDVLVIVNAWNTRQEAAAVIRLMAAERWTSLIVVTSPFHSRRALFTIERAAHGGRFLSAPVAARAPEWRPERWWSRRRDAGLTVREWMAWANTLAGGLE
jgi:uncharacterized SAM-binding protein YcdF (DUF218 family)